MKYYKGHCDKDIPLFGGKYVEENGYGHEEFNFLPIELEGEENDKCVGFVEPKSHGCVTNKIHIERIEGCEESADDDYVTNVLVVWCAKRDSKDITVVGWYKNAWIWKELQGWTLDIDGEEQERWYNVMADTKNCVLLPPDERNRWYWEIPSAKYTKKFGFGQAMVWYASEPESKEFKKRLVEHIENYSGENWIDKYPDEI